MRPPTVAVVAAFLAAGVAGQATEHDAVTPIRAYIEPGSWRYNQLSVLVSIGSRKRSPTVTSPNPLGVPVHHPHLALHPARALIDDAGCMADRSAYP